MRLAVLVAVAAITSPAVADDCDVRVVRAPKRVRAAIEARSGIEVGCTPLEVRVTRKRNKFKVTATTEDGEVREGEAKDPGRVAELVMTWAQPAPDEAPEPVAEVEPEPPVVAEAEPEPLPADTALTLASVSASPRRETGRDVAVGVLASTISYGLRAEGDLLASHGFSLGVSVGVADTIWKTGDAMSGASLDMRDITGAVTAAKTFGTGAWRLRVQAGIGFVYTRYVAKSRTAPFADVAAGDGTTRMIEGAITLSRELSSGWAVSVGPLLTYFAQTLPLDEMRRPQRVYDLGGYVAIRKRL